MSQVTVWHDGGCPLDHAEMLARFHADATGGPLLSGVGAFSAMWRVIPILRPLARAARSLLVSSVLQHVYTKIMRVRPHLQQWVARRKAWT